MQLNCLVPLVQVLLEGDAFARGYAVDALAHLATAFPKKFDEFYMTGVTPKLLELLKMDAHVLNTLIHACTALAMVRACTIVWLASECGCK